MHSPFPFCKAALLATRGWCVVLLLALGSSWSASAQMPAPRPAGAHWQVRTDPHSRTTVISFLMGTQLLHQEQLAGRYLKFSPRNVRRLDKLLEGLLNPQWATQQLHTLPLASAPLPRNASLRRPPAPATSPDSLQVNAFLTDWGKLKVALLNPGGLPLHIRLSDPQEQTLYHELTRLSGYRRSFDLGSLPSGSYQLHIRSAQQAFTYRLVISPSCPAYRVQSLVNVATPFR